MLAIVTTKWVCVHVIFCPYRFLRITITSLWELANSDLERFKKSRIPIVTPSAQETPSHSKDLTITDQSGTSIAAEQPEHLKRAWLKTASSACQSPAVSNVIPLTKHRHLNHQQHSKVEPTNLDHISEAAAPTETLERLHSLHGNGERQAGKIVASNTCRAKTTIVSAIDSTPEGPDGDNGAIEAKSPYQQLIYEVEIPGETQPFNSVSVPLPIIPLPHPRRISLVDLAHYLSAFAWSSKSQSTHQSECRNILGKLAKWAESLQYAVRDDEMRIFLMLLSSYGSEVLLFAGERVVLCGVGKSKKAIVRQGDAIKIVHQDSILFSLDDFIALKS